MQRTTTTLLALAVTGAIAVAGCGAAGSLRADNAHAKSSLQAAKSLSVTLGFSDPDGKLAKAIRSGDSTTTQAQAAAVIGATISFTVSANGGRTLFAKGDPNQPLSHQVKQSNFDLTVSGLGGKLAEIRLVDGILYATSDIAAVKKAADLGGPGAGAQVDAFLTSVPPQLKQGADDLKAGKWLKVPIATYVEQLQKLAKAGGGAAPDPAKARGYAKLGKDLQAAIKPNIGLTDLGATGDSRNVSIDIKVKQALTAVLGVLSSDAATLGLPAGLIPKGDALEDVSDKTLSATLTITRGHYTKLSVPFAGLAGLDAHPSTSVPPFGSSAIVLQLDDSAAPVIAPTNVSSFDIGALIDQFVSQFGGVGAAASLNG